MKGDLYELRRMAISSGGTSDDWVIVSVSGDVFNSSRNHARFKKYNLFRILQKGGIDNVAVGFGPLGN
jgi:hypothetical protein